jgi:hypothetical protein
MALGRPAGLLVEAPEQNALAERIALPYRDERGHDENSRGKRMKTTTILAIALGLGSLAACNKSPQQQAADNYEANADNAADQMEANVDNAADNMTATTDNAADSMKAAADNKSDAMKNAADQKADAIKNGQ